MTNVGEKWGELELGREEKWSWIELLQMELARGGRSKYKQDL